MTEHIIAKKASTITTRAESPLTDTQIITRLLLYYPGLEEPGFDHSEQTGSVSDFLGTLGGLIQRRSSPPSPARTVEMSEAQSQTLAKQQTAIGECEDRLDELEDGCVFNDDILVRLDEVELATLTQSELTCLREMMRCVLLARTQGKTG